jgi:hypothetical protein
MGRTLWGVDLDESPAGGLIERLLTDEELAMLADGGQPPGDEDDENDDRESEAENDESDDVDPDLDDIAGDADAGADEFAWEGESASTFGADGPPDSDESGGLREKITGTRMLLLKAAVALAVLAVVAVLVWKYLGRFVEAAPVPDRLRGSSDGSTSVGDDGPDVDEDAPSARRRAKTPGVAGDEDESDEREEDLTETFEDLAEHASVDDEDEDDVDDSEDTDTEDAGRAVDDDVDVGALVGLAALALIAAVVRKFGERPERDPLVDGADDE